MDEDQEAKRLLHDQAVREQAERAAAEKAREEAEALAHERRSEKAAYLREKLEERLEAEDDEQS